MPYYRTCPVCGAHLDPGEKCDCKKENAPPSANGEASNTALRSAHNHKDNIPRRFAPVNNIKMGGNIMENVKKYDLVPLFAEMSPDTPLSDKLLKCLSSLEIMINDAYEKGYQDGQLNAEAVNA